MNDEKSSIGMRLAIRSEGAFVNAYFALEDTMEGAIQIGALKRALADRPTIFERWKALMADAVADMVEKVYGERPEMPERPAPEHERSGRS